MIELIIFLFPAGLSLKIKDDLFKKKLNVKDYILIFIKYTLVINLIVFAILFLYSMGTTASINYALDNIGFIFKYLLLAIIIAIFLPIFDEYIRKNATMKINFKRFKSINERKKGK